MARRDFLAAAAASGVGLVANAAEAVMIDGFRLNYEVSGSGHPVVLIHGASGNLREMTFRLAPMLAERNLVIAFDRPGHGLSDWVPEGASLSVQVALMRKSLAQLGIKRATVIGHSYGGSVALAWAIDAPGSVSGLMLLAAPSQVWPGGLGAVTDILANPVTGPLVAQTARFFVTRGFAEKAAATVFSPQPVPPGYIEHLGLDLVLRPRTLRANALQLSALKEQIRTMVPAYPTLPMPVEILHGTADTSVPIEIHSIPLATQIPEARLTRLEGVGHMIHQTHPDIVLKALRRLPPAPLPNA